MSVQPATEEQKRGAGDWLRDRRFRLALLIAFVESLLVVTSSVGWFWVVGAAAVAVVLYMLGRRTSSRTVHEATWILAVSQLIAVIVPVLWEIVKGLAIIVLALLALFFVVILLIDRPGGSRSGGYSSHDSGA